jgi:SNF2 family DNA or RNA helicase
MQALRRQPQKGGQKEVSIIRAEIAANRQAIDLRFPYSPEDVATVKLVPGRRFVGAPEGPLWRVPLDMYTGRKLRELFGNRLQLGPGLMAWGREQRNVERNLASITSATDYPLEQLQISRKLPELATWFRPYQRADVAALAAASMLNGNDQGLGKTTEIIGAVYEANLEHGPHLVVAPLTSLESVWAFEIERWTGDEIWMFSGEVSKEERDEMLADLWQGNTPHRLWFLTTADALRRHGDVFAKVNWATFTIDEFHRTGLTNASGSSEKGTIFSQVAKRIPAQRRWGLSGTPMGGKPLKLWGALHWKQPEGREFSSKHRWAEQHLKWEEEEVYVKGGRGRKRVVRSYGGIKDEDSFYRHLAPHMLRHLKSQVLPQLPPKQHIEVLCDMTKGQAKQYRSFEKNLSLTLGEHELSADILLAQWARLKVLATAACDGEPTSKPCVCKGQDPICPFCLGDGKREHLKLIPTRDSGKLPALLDRLMEAGIDPADPSGDNVAVIASQHKEVVYMVHDWLADNGISSVTITGDTKASDRAQAIRDFQAGNIRVVVMTTTAGGVSITLDRADTMHVLDETWNPDDQTQLEDRIHRASRIHQVTIYQYRSRDTVEDYIHKVAKEKTLTNRTILDLLRNRVKETVSA